MREATGSGAANDAEVQTGGTPDQVRNREYLATVADEAEAAVEAVQDMIKHLQDSLKERKAAAAEARAQAKKES